MGIPSVLASSNSNIRQNTTATGNIERFPDPLPPSAAGKSWLDDFYPILGLELHRSKSMDFNHQLQVWLTRVYDFTIIPTLERLQRPSSIQIIRITVGSQIYWLRLHNANDSSLNQIENEARAIEYLHHNDVNVARPIRRKDGTFVGRLEDYRVIMFAHAKGLEVKIPTLEQAAALGSLIARIHVIGRTLNLSSQPLIDYCFLGEKPLNHMEPYCIERRTELKKLRMIATSLRDQVWIEGKNTELPSGFCHGDVHLENVTFDSTSPTIFDFEACAIGPYVYDIACYWRKLVLANWNTAIYKTQWEAFLNGYQAVRLLQDSELGAIPALATLRAIWVMALPAQPGVTWGTDWLNDDSYFDAHFKMIQSFARYTDT